MQKSRPAPAAQHGLHPQLQVRHRPALPEAGRSTTLTSRTARSTRCPTCSAPPATRRRWPRCPSPMDSWDQLWDAKYKGDISMLDSDAQHARRRAHQAGLLASTPPARRSSTPRRQVLIEQKPLVLKYDAGQHAAQHRPGPRPHALLGRRRRAGASRPSRRRASSTSCPARATTSGPTASSSPRRRENVYAAHLFLNHMLDPKQAGAGGRLHRLPAAWSRRARSTSRPPSCRRAMRPTAEQLANGKVFREDVGEFEKAVRARRGRT